MPVHIVNGFLFSLPGKTRRFFQRIYFARYPRPIQPAPGLPFPRTVNIITIEAPAQQGIVLRKVNFTAWQHSGIGVDDIVPLDDKRLTGTVGFRFLVGNQGLTDYDSNLASAFGGSAARTGGNLAPFGGRSTPQVVGENFATYVRPGDQIKADAKVIRPPDFDVRLFAVEMSGWIVGANELDRILSHLWG